MQKTGPVETPPGGQGTNDLFWAAPMRVLCRTKEGDVRALRLAGAVLLAFQSAIALAASTGDPDAPSRAMRQKPTIPITPPPPGSFETPGATGAAGARGYAPTQEEGPGGAPPATAAPAPPASPPAAPNPSPAPIKPPQRSSPPQPHSQ